MLGTSVVDALKPVVEGTWVAEARGTDEARLEAIHRELSRATSLVYHEVSAAVIAAKVRHEPR